MLQNLFDISTWMTSLAWCVLFAQKIFVLAFTRKVCRGNSANSADPDRLGINFQEVKKFIRLKNIHGDKLKFMI